MTIQKIPHDITANVFALLLVILILCFYGRTAIEWVLMKLHEFFIQRGLL